MPPQQPPQTTADLRQTLLTTIDKLADRSTFAQSSGHLNHLAKSLPSDHLATFLGCILTVDATAKTPTRVHCLTLISLLAVNQSSAALAPHLPKIVASIVMRLREPESSAVRAACAEAAAALSPHNFAVVVESLIGFVSSEQYVGALIGGCVCLKAAVDAVDGGEIMIGGGDKAMLRRVLTKAMKLVKVEGFKAKAALMGVMATVVGVNGGVVINGKFGGGSLVGNVVCVAVEMLSSEDWGARKGGAEVLQMVADVVNVDYASHVKKFVVSSLVSRRFDKVKITREIMNRAWEAWKAIPSGPEEVLSLSRSNSSVSKDSGSGGGVSPPLSRRSSFAGSEVVKPKQLMTKSRSSASIPPSSMSTITRDNIGREMPQRQQILSKSRSSLSDDSTMSDSTSVSKTSFDIGFETPQSKKQISKTRPSVPEDSSVYKTAPSRRNGRGSLDWNIQIAVPSASSVKFESEDEIESRDKSTEVTTSSSDRWNIRVSSLTEEDADHGYNNRDRLREEKVRGIVDSAELSLIRNQLHQIERQQSDLLQLVQRFMGNSQYGIDSLKTRVSGLEKALDMISHDLAVQTGRVANNGSAGSICCPSTEFLSPKFWRRTEGRSSNAQPSPNKDTHAEALTTDGIRLYEQNGRKGYESRGIAEVNASKSAKSMSQTSQRGRTCSPRSFDAASTTAFMTPGVTGT